MSKVIIIGSGLGGLTCGFILQKNGYDVTVLEQGHQIGGCLQCFSRQGVKFETGMHFIGSAAEGQTMNRLMNFLCLTDIELSPLDPKGYDTIALAGETFRFPNGRDAFVEQMSSYFPKEKDNLKHYIDLVARIASASTLNSLTSEERDLAMNTEYQTRSINDVLEGLFRDKMLRNVLVGNLPLYAAERDKTPFAQHAFIMDFYNQSSFRVVGGSDVIAHSLARSIKEMGGQVLTDKRACRIRCNETQATGVETADECFFPADYVVSTVHPARLLELLDTKLIRPAFRSRLSNIPNTTGCFTLYVKFKENTMPYMNTNFYGYHSSSPWDSDRHDYLYMHHAGRAHTSGIVERITRLSSTNMQSNSFKTSRGITRVSLPQSILTIPQHPSPTLIIRERKTARCMVWPRISTLDLLVECLTGQRFPTSSLLVRTSTRMV